MHSPASLSRVRWGAGDVKDHDRVIHALAIGYVIFPHDGIGLILTDEHQQESITLCQTYRVATNWYRHTSQGTLTLDRCGGDGSERIPCRGTT